MKTTWLAGMIGLGLLLGLLPSACGSSAVVAAVTPAAETPAQATHTAPALRSPIPPPTRRIPGNAISYNTAIPFTTDIPRATDLPTNTAVPTATDTPTTTTIPRSTGIPSLTPLPPPYVYVFPIQPPRAATFGDGVKGHGYPATDLFALVGTEYVAVTSGVVEFVSTRDDYNPDKPDPAKRSGLAVAILGDDGLRYYGSHLSGIAAGIRSGERVQAGQLLGYVGASGDARGKTAHLHFGISHPTTPDDWKTRRGEINPYPYLLAWKEGKNLTPHLP
jgi:murein DD-endopeptidase MepM/ murein hydrolase activator NlpD